MKKQLILLLVISFITSLMPVGMANAITQNQINSEVQIVCPDDYGNWFSGSGTIIDPKGIILTNKHVVTDEKGSIMNTCFVGFVESISSEPNFGTQSNPNIAAVKYYTSSDDMDVAILYLNNSENKVFPYIDIWSSDSSTLKFGDKLEVIGFPSIGGSTITYSSGDFSGFGSESFGTQNYIKTTAPLEHGNSGGASYNTNAKFIGIPTMVVAGTLNSLSYILSINSIKGWLSKTLGSDYKQKTIEMKQDVVRPAVSMQNDTTPPIIKNDAPRDFFWFNLYDESNNELERNYAVGYDTFKDMYVSGSSNRIRIIKPDLNNEWNLKSMDSESGVYSAFYSFTNDLSKASQNIGTEYIFNSDNDQVKDNNRIYTDYLTPIISLPNIEGTYYITLRFRDNSGNISNPYILTYVYEKNNHLKLKNIKFYSDSSYRNMIGNYDFSMTSEGWTYPQYFQYCATKYKDIYVKWQYENNYERYTVRHYGYGIGEMSAPESIALGGIETTSLNKYKVANLNLDLSKEKPDPYRNNLYKGDICYNGDCKIDGITSSFLLKPQIANATPSLEGVNRTVIFIYNQNLPFDFMCGEEDKTKGGNLYGQAYYVLKQGKSLIEDSKSFDDAQLKIAAAIAATESQSSTQEENNEKNIDLIFAGKLKGQILLQVEKNGEAYYVYPNDSKRYYLGRPTDAFNVMRKLGLGATHEFIKSRTIYPTNVLGKILIDVGDNGKAYYIYPKDKKAYYLGRPTDAFKIMREKGLGVSNVDIGKIGVGEIE